MHSYIKGIAEARDRCLIFREPSVRRRGRGGEREGEGEGEALLQLVPVLMILL